MLIQRKQLAAHYLESHATEALKIVLINFKKIRIF
jgi:hypothetical protein